MINIYELFKLTLRVQLLLAIMPIACFSQQMAHYFTTRSKEQLCAMFLETKQEAIFTYLGKDHSSIPFKDSPLKCVSISGGFIYQGLCLKSA